MKDLYDFNSLLKRKNTDCTKWDALKRDYGRDDLTPFWVADMDFAVLPEISEAIRNRAALDQTFGYTFTGTIPPDLSFPDSRAPIVPP